MTRCESVPIWGGILRAVGRLRLGWGVNVGEVHKCAEMGGIWARGEAVRVAVDLGRVLAGVLWRVISARVRFGAVGRSVGGLRAFRGSVGVFARLSAWAVRFPYSVSA